MTNEEYRELAKARGVSVTTIKRWLKVYGEELARERTKTTPSEAGKLGRKTSGDGWLWRAAPARTIRYQPRSLPYDW